MCWDRMDIYFWRPERWLQKFAAFWKFPCFNSWTYIDGVSSRTTDNGESLYFAPELNEWRMEIYDNERARTTLDDPRTIQVASRSRGGWIQFFFLRFFWFPFSVRYIPSCLSRPSRFCLNHWLNANFSSSWLGSNSPRVLARSLYFSPILVPHTW